MWVRVPPSAQFSRDRPLAPFTSWKVGGPAAFFAEPADSAALATCLAFAAENQLPVLALGGGTNLLVSDTGFPGLVVRCGTRDWSVDASSEGALLRAGARAPLAVLARGTAKEGWAGLEWAEGIPGTIGGAVIGNAGAFGGDIGSVFRSATAYSPSLGEQILRPVDLAFCYRGSALRSAPYSAPQNSPFLLTVELALRAGDTEGLGATIRSYAARRRVLTPSGASCGSVFKNPPGDHAGRLIEAAGLKGAEEGAAVVSPIHANYIINRGGATAANILTLMSRVRRTVYERFGVTLEPEVRLVGFSDAALTGLRSGLSDGTAR